MTATPRRAASRPRSAHAQAPAWRLTGQLEVGTDSGSFLGPTRARLLEAIAEHGSINRAARHVPLSYKAAWDAVEAMNQQAAEPLVLRSTGGRAGGGTRLTEHGQRVLALYRALQAELQATLDSVAVHAGTEPRGDQPAFRRLLRRLAVRSSARNQFTGTVDALHDDGEGVSVSLRLSGGASMMASVTRDSAAQLALAPGAEVVALVKAPSVRLCLQPAQARGLANRLWGTVRGVVRGTTRAEVTLALQGGGEAVATVPCRLLDAHPVRIGERALAAFAPASVILVGLE
jgi:molybdate transport system regulatory protein